MGNEKYECEIRMHANFIRCSVFFFKRFQSLSVRIFVVCLIWIMHQLYEKDLFSAFGSSFIRTWQREEIKKIFPLQEIYIRIRNCNHSTHFPLLKNNRFTYGLKSKNCRNILYFYFIWVRVWMPYIQNLDNIKSYAYCSLMVLIIMTAYTIRSTNAHEHAKYVTTPVCILWCLVRGTHSRRYTDTRCWYL